MPDPTFIHAMAEVSPEARIGDGTRVWSLAQVREHAIVGSDCNIGRGAYIGVGVHIGARVKIQNYALVYEGVTIEDGVFIGPRVCFTNDLYPRAITRTGALKRAEDWQITPTLVRQGASLGAGAVIRCGVAIGTFALVGADALVTKDVLPHALVIGHPARPIGYVCYCAHRLTGVREEGSRIVGWCSACEETCVIERPA